MLHPSSRGNHLFVKAAEVAVIVSLGLSILCIDVGYLVCVARSRLCRVEMIILPFFVVTNCCKINIISFPMILAHSTPFMPTLTAAQYVY